MTRMLLALSLVALSLPVHAVEEGDEADLTSAAVTARTCAERAIETGDLEEITNCSVPEVQSGLVVVDVAEMQMYELAPKTVHRYELEHAFRGGSIDLVGTVVAVADGVPVVEVEEYTITPKPKAGSFKGCL